MKLRTIFLFGAGVVAGLAIAKKMNEDDPEVLHGPAQGRATANPALVSAARPELERLAKSTDRELAANAQMAVSLLL